MNGDLVAELALAFGTLGGVIAYAIGGIMHIAIDRHEGKKLLAKYWAGTDEKIASVKADVLSGVHTELEEALRGGPALSSTGQTVAQGMEGFLRSPSGVQWAQELAELAAGDVERKFLARGDQMRGGAKKNQYATTSHILLNNIDFGDRHLNAAWAYCPEDVRVRAALQIAKAINRAGFVLVPINGDAGQLALEGPPAENAAMFEE